MKSQNAREGSSEYKLIRKELKEPDMNPRTCIVTRSEKDPGSLIRFVLDGSDAVVPDIKRKLPGRGVWVSATRSHIDQACKRGLFERGFRKKVQVDPNLADLVEMLFEQSVIGLLAMARKAGVLVSGRAKVEDLIRSGDAALILRAKDVDGDSKTKIEGVLARFAPEVEVFEHFERDVLDGITAGANTAHIGIATSGLAQRTIDLLKRLERYGSD